MTCILPGGLAVLDAVGSSGWNPVDLSNIALSNNNKTAAGSSSLVLGNVRGTASRNAGKRYFEATVNSVSPTTKTGTVGLATAGFDITAGVQLGFETGGISIGLMFNFSTDSVVFYAASSQATAAVIVAGNIIGVALDMTGAHPAAAFTLNGVGVGGSVSMASIAPGTALFPGFSGINSSGSVPDQVTLNTRGPFTYTPPTGFLAWG
jgi:hypothetical protein